MANTYTLISSITVGAGGASSIDFTSIPNTFTDLQLICSNRAASGSPELLINLNNSSSDFTIKYLQGSGSSVASNSLTRTYIGEAEYSTRGANIFGSTSVYIPNYAGSNYKSFSVDNVQENNATASYSELVAGLWSNTTAINRITLYCSSSINFAQYSSAYLYGISNS